MAAFANRLDDPLWKSVIEQTCVHFLTFFFPGIEKYIDFKRKFVFLDKEFEALYPLESSLKGVRFVDKLIRIPFLNSVNQYVLCHIEVQSNKSKDDLAKRMFGYFYRIDDKHNLPLTAIVILLDNNPNYRPSVYSKTFMGTNLHFSFNCYKIIDQDEAALRADPNPFAVVVLTALLALKRRQLDDEQIKAMKLDLYKEMLKRNMDATSRKAIYDFLVRYVSFSEENMYTVFENEVLKQIGRNTTMGTREYLLEKAKNQGIEKGIEQGIEQGIEKGIEQGIEQGERQKGNTVVENLIKEFGLSNAEIARIADVTEEFVEHVRRRLI